MPERRNVIKANERYLFPQQRQEALVPTTNAAPAPRANRSLKSLCKRGFRVGHMLNAPGAGW